MSFGILTVLNYFQALKKCSFLDFEISQFEAIFHYANEGILIANSSGIIIAANPFCTSLFGYKTSELIGEKIEILIPNRFDNHAKLRTNYVSHPEARNMGVGRDLWAKRKSGEEFPVEVSLSPFDADGVVFIVAFIIDISKRKALEQKEETYKQELEKEVEDRTLVLKEAISKLEKTKNNLDESLKREMEANSLKSKFVSIASHEFRTPLSTMLSSLVLVEKYHERDEPEKMRKHIERIRSSINVLTEILNDVLSLNKLEEGKVIPRPSYFEALPYFQNLVTELSLILKPSQKIILEKEIRDDFQLFQDSTLLQHIVVNLISNAIKFSPEGSEIEVRIESSQENLKIEVKDQGIGIPENNLNQLFERFYRADNVGSIQGTGLGLSIVKHYTELLGGNIHVESILEKGTTFFVELPITFKTS